MKFATRNEMCFAMFLGTCLAYFVAFNYFHEKLTSQLAQVRGEIREQNLRAPATCIGPNSPKTTHKNGAHK